MDWIDILSIPQLHDIPMVYPLFMISIPSKVFPRFFHAWVQKSCQSGLPLGALFIKKSLITIMLETQQILIDRNISAPLKLNLRFFVLNDKFNLSPECGHLQARLERQRDKANKLHSWDGLLHFTVKQEKEKKKEKRKKSSQTPLLSSFLFQCSTKSKQQRPVSEVF